MKRIWIAIRERKRCVGMACGLLLCVMLVGCGSADRALVIGGSAENAESIAEASASTGSIGSESADSAGTGRTALDLVSDVTTVTASGESTATAKAEEALIYVYVCGAVQEPGVVALPVDARAEEALALAGGFREDADLSYVNLAAKLTDGEKLYFPTVDEAETLTTAMENAAAGIVNINTAGSEELCTLSGIGESRAAAIIAYRTEHGGFASKEDIMLVSGIGESAYAKLADFITVD